MKKFRKLIPAFCMLLVSAMLVGTSTFAWFSMNNKVAATGMQISAKSDSAYLVINTGASFNSAGTDKEVTSAAEAKSLYPVAPVSVLTSASAASDVTTASKWHYAYSNDPTTSTKTGDYIECKDLENYVASETFYIGLNEKSGLSSLSNLKVSKITLPENKAIKVVLVCGSKVAVAADDVLADSVGKEGVAVTVYYYIDGDESVVYTNNATTLSGQVSLEFTAELPTEG